MFFKRKKEKKKCFFYQEKEKKEKKMSFFINLPTFSKETPNKIGNGIEVSKKNTLIKTEANSWHDTIAQTMQPSWRVAIAELPIDAKIDGHHAFCVRIDNNNDAGILEIGLTSTESFDSTKRAFWGFNARDFTGCGLNLASGELCYKGSHWHNIIDVQISKTAKEIIVVLSISNNGEKKEIRFLCDGNKSDSTDVSKYLFGHRIFPAFFFVSQNQQVTTIPIDQLKNPTHAKNVLKECTEEFKIEQRKRFVTNALQQTSELAGVFLRQQQILVRGTIAKSKIGTNQ